MPAPEVLHLFKDGLNTIQNANDFATLRATIDKIVSVCPPDELPLAKDAIARVIRAKQAIELAKYQGYPQASDELDKKYRDLYIVLRTAQSKVAVEKALTDSKQTQMAKIKGFSGLNISMMIVDWLRSKRKYLMAGGALGAVGGAYMLYKHAKTDNVEESEAEKESNFDKTIKSIQKYKTFTQVLSNPDFSGNYSDLINGNYKKTKKREIKKDDEIKSIEWDRDEQTLMKEMDKAFTSLSKKPELDYQLPQLPAPRNINPRDVLGDDAPLELRLGSSVNTDKKEENKPKVRRRRTKRSRMTQVEPINDSSEMNDSVGSDDSDELDSNQDSQEYQDVKETIENLNLETAESIEAPVKKKRRVINTDNSDENMGRLIPIVKRTKRVRKVNA